MISTLVLGVLMSCALTFWLYTSQTRNQIEQTLRGVTFAAEQTNQLIQIVDTAIGVVAWQIRVGRGFSELQFPSEALTSSFQELKSIFVVTPDGRVVANLHTQETAFVRDVSDQLFFQLARDAEDGMLIVSTPVSSALSTDQTYPMSAPVFDDAGNLKAVIVALIEPEVFDVIRREFVGHSGIQLSLVDQTRGVIAPFADPGRSGNGSDQKQVIEERSWTYRGKEFVVAKTIESQRQISLLAKQPISEIQGTALKYAALPGVLGLLLTLSLVVIARQITEKNKRIQRGEDLIAATSKSIPGAIIRFEVSQDGTCTAQYISEGSQDIWEHEADQLRGDVSLLEASAQNSETPGLKETLLQAKAAGEPWSHRWRIITPSGKTKWVQGRGIQSAGGQEATTWHCVVLDVTDLLDAQEELQQHREMLAFSSRLEAVGRLTAGVAHEFNNLMAVIMGNIELALDTERVPEDVARACLEDALAALQRGARQTSDLLKFGRKAKLNPEILTLNQAMVQLQSIVHTTIPENIEATFELCDDPWYTKLDAAQLEGAILNLVINARDALTSGGTIRLTTENVRVEARVQSDIPAGDYVKLTVWDNGTGMSPEVLEKAIDPYFTTKPVGQGTGLGLSVVHGFATQSGGYCRIHSIEDTCTSVSLWFERVQVAVLKDVGAADRPDEAVMADGGGTVLLVEDNADVRKTLSLQLSVLGYNVITAEDGQSALDILRGEVSIDLVLSDIVMPGQIQGNALAETILKEMPQVPVILITGYAEDSPITDSQVPVINKPLSTEKLQTVVRAHIVKSIGSD